MFRFLILLLIVSTFVKNDVERVSWSDHKKITWEDFKGTPEAKSVFVASLNSGISHSYSLDKNGYLIKEESEVKAYFYPTLSWYKPELATPSVLRHEQVHFDISELYARKLRMRVANFEFTSNSQKEIKDIYREIEKGRQEMQQAFDKETIHSVYGAAEDFWEKKIAELLKEYDNWK
ncbi:DUF922 domain-containing protein [Leeuwenhoekiella sp. A16]|uniref:DUF922 domain-containing protein n=1 Tax=Leeuwenhoekiella sp. A16 TaxID=3141462 RepID=UPI003A80BBFE